MYAKINIHGVWVNVSNPSQALAELEALHASGKNGFVGFYEANLFSLAIRNARLRGVLNVADMLYPDGIAVAKAIEYRLGVVAERVSGPAFLLNVCDYGRSRGWRHFFYGGGEGVADKMVSRLKAHYPDLQVVGTYAPPFRPLNEAEELEVKTVIENARPDFLWVGLGGPKQECWIVEHSGKINVPVMLAVGAAFDFHSGARPWAPLWVRKMGMEWLFRMCSGGRRMFLRNIRCVVVVAAVLAGDRVKGWWKLSRKDRKRVL